MRKFFSLLLVVFVFVLCFSSGAFAETEDNYELESLNAMIERLEGSIFYRENALKRDKSSLSEERIQAMGKEISEGLDQLRGLYAEIAVLDGSDPLAIRLSRFCVEMIPQSTVE